MNKVMSVAPSTLDDLTDDTDGNDNNDTEMEELLKTVKGKIQFVRMHFVLVTYVFVFVCVCRTHPRSFEATSWTKQNQITRVWGPGANRRLDFWTGRRTQVEKTRWTRIESNYTSPLYIFVKIQLFHQLVSLSLTVFFFFTCIDIQESIRTKCVWIFVIINQWR